MDPKNTPPDVTTQTHHTPPPAIPSEPGTTSKISFGKQYSTILFVAGGLLLGLVIGLGTSFYLQSQTEPAWKLSLEEMQELDNQTVEKYESPEPAEWTDPTPEVESLEDTTDYSVYYKNLVIQEGVTWLLEPEPLPDLKLISPGASYDDTSAWNIFYYKIGEYFGGDIIYVERPCNCMGGNTYSLILQKKDGFYFLQKYTNFEEFYQLTNPDLSQLKNDYVKFLPNSKLDSSTSLSALNHDRIPYQNTELVSKYGFSLADGQFSDRQSFFSDETSKSLQADTKYGPLFRIETTTGDGANDVNFVVRTVAGFINIFELELPYVRDDGVPQITWTDGTENTDYYRSTGLGGCGGGGPVTAATRVAAEDLLKSGRTSDGRDVFTITNPKHQLITRVLDVTGGLVYDYDNGASRTYTITPAEFIEERGVIIIEDDLGQQNVFTHGKFGPQVECAKPVIYLYPEATTTITVSVDAIVTKSEPLYQNGWITTATPEGRLTMADGSTYTSLFWDGYGRGEYATSEKGFVVRTEAAIATMETHLRIMGFNDREIADFSDFWTPHLPTTPYTKFHWLQTREMNELARLTIEPRPRTVLRAFVDFSGLSEPVALQPQTLQSIDRRGYTVTEWGGLMRK